jgi:hypothetical protein
MAFIASSEEGTSDLELASPLSRAAPQSSSVQSDRIEF